MKEKESKKEKEKDMAAWLLPSLVEKRFIVDMWRAGPCGGGERGRNGESKGTRCSIQEAQRHKGTKWLDSIGKSSPVPWVGAFAVGGRGQGMSARRTLNR